jgi:predicted PurR-regulated permease PerM
LYWILHEVERVNAVWSVIKGVFSPFVLGSVIAFILNVPMRAFERLLKGIKKPGLRRLIAVLLTFIALLLILALVFWLLIPQLIETIQSLVPKLQSFVFSVEEYITKVLNDNPQLMTWIVNNTDFESFNWGGLVEKVVSMLGNSVTTIVQSTFSALGVLAGAIFDFFIAIVFAVYCLFQKETLARQGRKLVYAYLPEKIADGIVRILRLTNATFSNFLSGQCVEVCILGCLFAVSMAIFRMPYIPLVSVLVAVTAFIPVVGAWVGCIFGAFLILVSNPLQALWFVLMFLILQQIENNLIYPRVVGTSIGLSGMWVLLAVGIGGELMGVAGMFLMIPVASVIYTLLQESARNRLAAKTIDENKLTAQEPELKSKFKAKRENRAAKRKKNANNKSESNE